MVVHNNSNVKSIIPGIESFETGEGFNQFPSSIEGKTLSTCDYALCSGNMWSIFFTSLCQSKIPSTNVIGSFLDFHLCTHT